MEQKNGVPGGEEGEAFMIHTWAASTAPLRDEEVYRFYYNNVPAFRREKADRIHFTEDKAQSVGAWILLQKMRAAYRISDTEVFNLSHSGIYVLCSIADGEPESVKVGCDIEVVKEARMKVAKRFFCRSEVLYIEGLEKGKQADAFYRYWVLKESFLKATRRGMGLDLRSFEIELAGRSAPVIIQKPDDIEEDYYYKEYAVQGVPAKIAVCSTKDNFDDILYIGEL